MSALVDALLIAPPYICLALAFGLLYGMLGVMDLTVAVRFCAAAYCGWCASGMLGWHPAIDPAVLVLSTLGAFVVSMICWQLLKPLARHDALTGLIGSLGIMQVANAAMQAGFGSAPKVFSSYPVESGIAFWGTTATPLQLTSFGFAILVVAIIAIVLRFTGWGRRLQIVAADPEVAEAQFGISRRRIEWITNLAIAMILAPAGVFYGASHGVSPTTGSDMALLAFVAAIVAGRQQPIGAVMVVVVLVMIRSVSIRWPILDFGVAMALGSAAFFVSREYLRSEDSRFLIAVATGVGGYITMNLLRDKLVVQLPTTSVPSAFQEVVPYCFILMSLLLCPTGILTSNDSRKV